MNDRELEELRAEHATTPEKPEIALALARELARRGEAAGSVAALRPALARNPTDAGLHGELLARSPRLRAPWPGPLGAGTSRASACARGARRARVHRRFFSDTDRGPPLVLGGGSVLRAGDGVLEEIDVEAERVRPVHVAGLRAGPLHLIAEDRILAKGDAGLILLEGPSRAPRVVDKGQVPTAARAVYVGPSGATAIGRGPQVRAIAPSGESISTRPLSPRACKRSAVLGGGEAEQERLASAFAGDPLGELWLEVQEPFLSVESKSGYPSEVVRYATAIEPWPNGHLPTRAPLPGEADRVDRLIAGPAGEPIVLLPVAMPSMQKEADWQGGAAVVAMLRAESPVAYDAPRRRLIVGEATELAVVPFAGPRSSIPVGATALACDVEGWIYALSPREDGVRIVCVDATGRALGGPAFAGATDLAIGDGVTLAYGPRVLYAIA